MLVKNQKNKNEWQDTHYIIIKQALIFRAAALAINYSHHSPPHQIINYKLTNQRWCIVRARERERISTDGQPNCGTTKYN